MWGHGAVEIGFEIGGEEWEEGACLEGHVAGSSTISGKVAGSSRGRSSEAQSDALLGRWSGLELAVFIPGSKFYGLGEVSLYNPDTGA